MLILRIRQAECALADGRLDEAYEIAQAAAVREHRHGQRLTGKLARAYANRGRASLAAGRYQDALKDCNKAEKLAGTTPEVGDLRLAVCTALEQRQRSHQEHAFKVDQARKKIVGGWLSAGEGILADASADDAEAKLLLRQAAVARLQIDEAVAKAERALASGELETAIDVIRRADVTGSENGKLSELTSKIKTQAEKRIRQDIEHGRIDLAWSLLERLSSITPQYGALTELHSVLSQCRQAADYLAQGRPEAAVPLLRRAGSMYPGAKWLRSAVDQARQAAKTLEDLVTGPLGLAASHDDAADGPCDQIRKGDNVAGSADRDGTRDHKAAPRPPRAPAASIPPSFGMQIDGVGSFLVFRNDRVTIGPVSSSARPEIGLMVDPNVPTVTIERIDGDYFIRSPRPIHVQDEVVTERLLADGDKIALSPRCRIKFQIPNPASTTAVLTLSGSRLGRPDVSHLILMDRDLLVGPTLGDHVRCEKVDDSVAFFMQNGCLLCRAKQGARVSGAPVGSQRGLPMGRHITIGQISLVLTDLE